jgi:hypothetical protein
MPKIDRRYSNRHLDHAWRKWRASDEASAICELQMNIHGLRATKINDLRRDRTEDGAIPDEIGISVRMISSHLPSPTRPHRPARAVTAQDADGRI